MLQYLGIASYGKHFRRPVGFESLTLHLGPADSMKIRVRQVFSQRGDQVRRQLITGGLARHHGDADHQRMIPRPGTSRNADNSES